MDPNWRISTCKTQSGAAPGRLPYPDLRPSSPSAILISTDPGLTTAQHFLAAVMSDHFQLAAAMSMVRMAWLVPSAKLTVVEVFRGLFVVLITRARSARPRLEEALRPGRLLAAEQLRRMVMASQVGETCRTSVARDRISVAAGYGRVMWSRARFVAIPENGRSGLPQSPGFIRLSSTSFLETIAAASLTRMVGRRETPA